MLNVSDDTEILRGYTTMIDLYNALQIITLLFFIQKILTFNLGVAFLKSVSISLAVLRVSRFQNISPLISKVEQTPAMVNVFQKVTLKVQGVPQRGKRKPENPQNDKEAIGEISAASDPNMAINPIKLTIKRDYNVTAICLYQPLWGFLPGPTKTEAVQPQKMAKGLKFQILEVEGLYYLSAPLFSHMQEAGFLMTWYIHYTHSK